MSKKCMQDKESIMVVRCELKLPSLGITVRHQVQLCIRSVVETLTHTPHYAVGLWSTEVRNKSQRKTKLKLKVLGLHIFETAIKLLFVIRSQWNFVCMFLKTFWAPPRQFKGKCLLKKFILQTCVKCRPINSENKDLTSYNKVWCT